jgi:hypothetical protein
LIVTIITLFTIIQNSITACRSATVESAGIGLVGIESSVVALLSNVQDTITTEGKNAVGSTPAHGGVSGHEGGRLVGVSDSLIAHLVDADRRSNCSVEDIVFNAVVSARAVGKLRKIVDNVFQEGVGNLTTSRALEEDGGNQVWVGGASSGQLLGEDQLEL